MCLSITNNIYNILYDNSRYNYSSFPLILHNCEMKDIFVYYV